MTKFQFADKVLHDGIEKEIKVASKNFSTKEIVYLLDTGEKVAESDLKPVKAKMTRTKKPTKKEQVKLDKMLKERLALISEFLPMIEESEDYDEKEFHKVLVELSADDFEKFQNDLIERSILENEDNTED